VQRQGLACGSAASLVLYRLGRAAIGIGLQCPEDDCRQRFQQLEQRSQEAEEQTRTAQLRLSRAQVVLETAMDQSSSVSLLERLNGVVDARASELRQLQQGAAEVATSLDQARATPDLAGSLSQRPALELMWAVAHGSETPEQKHQLHALLRTLPLGLVLDDSDTAALRVGMGCGGGPTAGRWGRAGSTQGPHAPPSADLGLRMGPGPSDS
jgi:hypothetical protein